MRRLLRIEARRNALPPLLPLCLVLLYLTPPARHLEPVALWTDRSTDLQSAVQMIGPFTAATAAWTGSREHRRGMDDLLASTPSSPGRRWLATWTATCGWAVLFYAALATGLFSITAVQATWGHPVIWPVLSGATSLIACATIGFAAGRLMPGRATTPLVGIGVLFAMSVAMGDATHGGTFGRLSPLYPSIGLESSVFYAVRPDLTFVQVPCYLGMTVALAGLLTLRGQAGSRQVRRAGAALAAGGLVLITAAFALTSTSRHDHQGVIVPALHDAATDRAIPYTPVCTHSALPVCLHPAYAAANERTVFDTTLNRIAAPLIGAPGMPVRAEQLPDAEQGAPVSLVEGDPPVLHLPNVIIHGHALEPPGFARAFRTRIALSLVIPAGTVAATQSCRCAANAADPAQRAVALYLLRQAGYTSDTGLIPGGTTVIAAERRLAALTPTARTTWFARHIAALRAGALTTGELP
jgi:hypothetical protein